MAAGADTKARIMEAARKHFNAVGFGATTLYELSREIGISRGNLAYHFKDKDTLLEAIAEDMWTQIEAERAKSRSMPSFENLHNEVQLYYKFQRAYAFIFLDTHVLNHPTVREGFRKMTVQAIRDNAAIIAYALRAGNLIQEPLPGVYHNLAFTTWMLAFFWLAQQIIRGEKTGEDGEKMIWSLLAPYFTEKGKSAFIRFFGEEYYENLGPAFDMGTLSSP